MSLGQPPQAHFSTVAEEPNHLVSTEVGMKTPVPHLPAHRVQLAQRGVEVYQVSATDLIVSVTGTQCRNLAR